MSADDAFNTMKAYFEGRPAARQALRYLKEGVEVGISIGGMIDCALFQREGAPVVEKRPAENPDVVFQIRPESIYVLNNQPSEDVGDIGIAILKEMLAGNISLRVTGGVFEIVRNGYLEIIREGGTRVSAWLATHGMTSVAKIITTIKSLQR